MVLSDDTSGEAGGEMANTGVEIADTLDETLPPTTANNNRNPFYSADWLGCSHLFQKERNPQQKDGIPVKTVFRFSEDAGITK